MNKRHTLTLGSLFDGSGGFPLGGLIAGIEPKFSSEIEPFPILVTHKRLPQVKHYGDVSALSGADLEPVDIITFGSPCQDLSIAGKRAGIQEGERSNLFFQAIRIIKEMREATDGRYPKYCVWENVPGAFSSNGGEDFRAVLEAVVGIKEEGVQVPAPDNHRWPKADIYLGDGWSLAYRVLDAQYWGVPQRRARIYLVADLNGSGAGEILFKSEGVSGYTPQGFRTWERAAGGAEEGAGEAGRRTDGGDRAGVTYCMNTQGNSGVGITEDKSLALVAQDHGNHPAVLQSAGFSTEHSAQSRSIGYEEEKSPTLRAGVVPAAMAVENYPTDGRVKIREDGQCQTLTERMGTGGNNVPLVAEPQGFDRYNGAVTGDVSHTLDAAGGNTTPMVFVKGTRPHNAQEGQEWKKGDVANTLNTFDVGESRCDELAVEEKQHPSYGIAKEAFNAGERAAFNFAVNEEVAPTLQTRGPGAVAKPEIKAYGVCSKKSHSMMSDNPHSGFYEAKTSRTLDRSGGNAVTSNQGGICIVAPVPEGREAVAFEPGAASRVGGHVYEDGKAGTLRANAGYNRQAVVAFTQNQRDEVRDLEGRSGALQAQPGMKQQTYVLQGSMIGRDEKNGLQGDGINEDVSFTLNTVDNHAVAAPAGEHYSTSKNSYHTNAVREQANTLVASDWKDPPTVSVYHSNHASGMNADFQESNTLRTLAASDYKDPPTVCEDPVYIVRRLTPTECARLQGFPDWWCSGLEIVEPSDEEVAYWKDVWDTWNGINGKKPKTEDQVRRWLASPYTDAAEYKLWGNGISLPIVYFVMSGIAWAAAEEEGQ